MNAVYVLWAAKDNAKAEHCKCRALGYLLEDDNWMASLWHNLATVYQQSAREWLRATVQGPHLVDPCHKKISVIPTQYN